MSTYPKGMHPGAVWKQTDFQVHTPRDPGWSGSVHLEGGTDETEAARHQWADRFIAQCIALKIEAVAITDHHDFCFIEYVQKALHRLPPGVRKPWVFPGVEVTCQDSVQCLVLFDQISQADVWNRLFGGHLQNIEAPSKDAARNPQATECGKDISSFIESVASDTKLNKCSIILPHASNENAHKSMIRKGFAPRFKTLPFDGVYCDKPYENLDFSTKQKIYGETPEWGSRRRGIIPTGDNRNQDFRRLAAHPCWIRLGEPTVESIRQAVLADQARISYEVPTLPAQRILELRIKSTLTGADFELSFNDGFTAVIGGRGSGKSAVLEYLRFGLGRSASDTDADADDFRSRDQQMISDTLKAGSVSVVLERDGVTETWTREGSQRDVINVAVADGSSEQLTVDAAQQRFRARAFYQKQLSTLVLDRTRAAEQITGIAAAEFINQRRLIDRDIAAAKRDVQASLQQVIELWVAEGEHQQSVAAVADLRRRLDAVRIRMGEAGLSAEDQTLLDDAPSYKLVANLATEAAADVVSDIASLTKQMTSLVSTNSHQWAIVAPKFEEVREIVDATNIAKHDLQTVFATAIETLRTLQLKQAAAISKFQIKQEAFILKHAAAVERQVSNKALVDEATRLNDELQVAAAGERKSLAKLDTLKEVSENLAISRSNLADKVKSLQGVLVKAAQQVQNMSENSLRAVANREEAPRQYVEALFNICDRNRIRDVQLKCEDRARQIASNQNDDNWQSVTDVILDVYKHKLQSGAQTLSEGDPLVKTISDALIGPTTLQQVGALFDSINDTAVAKMLTAVPEDFISFEYRDNKEFIPFGQASPGQQASALLQLLLNQEAGTLLIDQPEDDLDNRIIMKIATVLQTTKRKRQLVFATHNPNFVVNGDADKIVVLTSGQNDATQTDINVSPRISVDVDGAIETPPVRSAITETMEGGQAAFELRSRKYSFPLL